MLQTKGVVVRPAAAADAGSICAIYNTAIAERRSTFETEARSATEFAERISDARFPLLVSDPGEGVTGWAGLTSYSSRPCYAGNRRVQRLRRDSGT